MLTNAFGYSGIVLFSAFFIVAQLREGDVRNTITGHPKHNWEH